MRLDDRGVHGNGHAMMLELNPAEVLGAVAGWVAGKLDAPTEAIRERPARL